MDISKRIKSRREELGMSVEDLAKKINKNKATVYRYENGDIGKMPYDILKPLSDALNVSISYLLGSDSETQSLSKSEKKLLSFYNKLNSIGQNEACKRVSELTEIDKYTFSNHIETIAAHADHIDSEQINLINEDIEDMKNW